MKYRTATLLVALGLISGPLAAAPTVPAGYVSTPNGWTHPSCIHEVPNGATVDTERGNVLVNGIVVSHYAPCAYRPVPAHGRPAGKGEPGATAASDKTQPIGPTYGGWVEYTQQTAPAGQAFDRVLVTMTVPALPAQRTPQTLYYFPGLESSLDSDCGIVQPVLQWGVSPAGGGSYWSIASWWWGTTHQFHTTLTRVNSGDRITGAMNFVLGIWRVYSYYQNGHILSDAGFVSSCRFNQAFPAVFEVDTGAPISNCSQVPIPQASFSNIALYYGPYPNYNYVAYSPTNHIPASGYQPACPWGIVNGSNFTWLML